MRLRKLFIPNTVVFITFGTEEGLPFVAVPFVNLLIESALARAQSLYPVRLLFYTFEANHGHLGILVEDPELIPKFIGFLKGECAHYLNRLLGRKQHTVWVKRYDSPTILDLPKALEVFCYGLLNPVKDGLVRAMSEYPGVSSYSLFCSGVQEKRVKNIPRSAVPRLREARRPYLENQKLVEYLQSSRFESLFLRVEPEALRLAFHESRLLSLPEFRTMLGRCLDAAEVMYRKKRGNAMVVGITKLQRASMIRCHRPPITGRKMICLASVAARRISFVMFFKWLSRECRKVWIQWREGCKDARFPSGMFAPPMPRFSNFVPSVVL